jgi:signal peptidase I
LLGVFVLAASMSVAEQFVIWTTTPRPPRLSFLVGGFIFSAVAVWAAVVGTLALIMTGFGYLQVAGSGMSPTLLKGERLLYAKRLDTERLRHGSVVLFRLSEKSAWGQPGWLTVGRILAVPGDRLAIRDRSYTVNGGPGPPIAVTKPYAPILRVPEEPESITVPGECYFIVQDDPLNSYDSRVLFWMEGNAVASEQLFYLNGRGLFTRVE